jgi:hypothetical protein
VAGGGDSVVVVQWLVVEPARKQMKLCEVDQLCDGVGMKWKYDAVKKKRSRQKTHEQRVTAGLMEVELYFLSSGL